MIWSVNSLLEVNVLGQEIMISNILKHHLQDHKLSTRVLAKQAKISFISLKMILYGRLPTMNQLDNLTTAMGLEIGSLYPLYECQLRSCRASWQQTSCYLIHCAKHNLQNHFRNGIKHCYSMKHASLRLFHLAERLYGMSLFTSADIIYQQLIEASSNEGEPFLFVSREVVAMCHFRTFQQICGKQFGHAPSALRFIPFRNSLPIEYALEGLLLLSQNLIAQERYESAEQYADELCHLAYQIYTEKRIKWFNTTVKTIRPLLVYYGQAFLLKGIACEMRGLYSESKYWIMKYTDLSWFEDKSENREQALQRFRINARGNMMSVNIKCGDQKVIEDYVKFLKEYPNQIIDGLITLLSAANEFHYSIDDILEQFAEEIKSFHIRVEFDHSQRGLFTCQRYVQFHYHYAKYWFDRGELEIGIEHTLTSLHYAKGMKSNRVFVQSMSLFEKYRANATTTQQHCYEELCQDILKDTPDEGTLSYNFFWQMMSSGR